MLGIECEPHAPVAYGRMADALVEIRFEREIIESAKNNDFTDF